VNDCYYCEDCVDSHREEEETEEDVESAA
jgi:hypothetical protein